jgi:DNA invertase Pin-like site-specific DNA recombinase
VSRGSTNEIHGVNDTTAVVDQFESRIDVVFYGRASRDRTGLQSSVTTQGTKFDDLVIRNFDWNVLERFIDNDVSAAKSKVVRPEFERMMKMIERGELTPHLVVAYDVSRLMRTRRDKIRLEQLIDADIHLFDMRYRIDTRDKIGRIVFGIMAEMAIDRAQELADYQRDYHDRRRKNGSPSKAAKASAIVESSTMKIRLLRSRSKNVRPRQSGGA